MKLNQDKQFVWNYGELYMLKCSLAHTKIIYQRSPKDHYFKSPTESGLNLTITPHTSNQKTNCNIYHSLDCITRTVTPPTPPQWNLNQVKPHWTICWNSLPHNKLPSTSIHQKRIKPTSQFPKLESETELYADILYYTTSFPQHQYTTFSFSLIYINKTQKQ